MKCLHCLVEFHDEEKIVYVGTDRDNVWAIHKYACPACKRDNLFLANYRQVLPGPKGYFFNPEDLISLISIRPKGSARPPCPDCVPENIKEDYQEACLVLGDSPKASAALSRRCLQLLLEDVAKTTSHDLSKQIDEVLENGKLPTYISEGIDAIRNIGNFAAHPKKSISTGLIVPVEPMEAEWNLEVLETLFDFYYVLPLRTKEKRESINKKLIDVGKPPMKVSK